MNKDSVPIDIDPATLEIFKTVFESESGKRWFQKYVVDTISKARIRLFSTHDGVNGFLTIEGYHGSFELPKLITIKPEDSWFKKWIKRQLM